MRARTECDICGGDDHPPEAHGDALIVLQPSLHGIEEFTRLALDCCEDLEAMPETDIAYMRGIFDATEDEDLSMAADDCMQRLTGRLLELGYYVYDENDTFLVFGPIEERPWGELPLDLPLEQTRDKYSEGS